MGTTDQIYHILIVDDQKADVELALAAIRKHSLQTKVYHADSGESAIDFLLENGGDKSSVGARMPKLVLLDIMMPKMNGFEVLERLRHEGKTCKMPIVVFSSSDEPQDVKKAYALGATSYVVKPIGFDEFLKTVLVTCRYWLDCNIPCS